MYWLLVLAFSGVLASRRVAVRPPGGKQPRFDVNSTDNVVLYWGQSYHGYGTLGEYCNETPGDIYAVSFLHQFGSGVTTKYDIDGCDNDEKEHGVARCKSLERDIKACQGLNKLVFLSLGGEDGKYGFRDDDDGRKFANELWNTFGGGRLGGGTFGGGRPFGDAEFDGFDFDIEKGPTVGYAAMTNELRHLSQRDNKTIYISAAPQCLLPDEFLHDLIERSHVDFAFVQFYNNDCAIGREFNWADWEQYAAHKSFNKNIRLFLGLPGRANPKDYGYQVPEVVASILADVNSSGTNRFGGIMLWNAWSPHGLAYARSAKLMVEGVYDPRYDILNRVPQEMGEDSERRLAEIRAALEGLPRKYRHRKTRARGRKHRLKHRKGLHRKGLHRKGLHRKGLHRKKAGN